MPVLGLVAGEAGSGNALMAGKCRLLAVAAVYQSRFVAFDAVAKLGGRKAIYHSAIAAVDKNKVLFQNLCHNEDNN